MRFGTSPHTRRFADHEISKICGVSQDTVYRWRSGQREIPTGYKRLLDLIASRRVIPDSWPGWWFDEKELVSPLHDRFTHVFIEQFRMFLGFNQSLETTNRQLHEYIDYLESVAPRAKVVTIDRKKMRPSATAGHEFNRLFQKA
jgi:hypothetical protein